MVETAKKVDRLSREMDPTFVPFKITCVIVVTPFLCVSK
jgi:hypothetical protein